MWKLVASWAALGVVLSGATQLRVGNLPLGASEALLVAWVLFTSFLLLRGADVGRGRSFLGLSIYWGASLVLLAFGSMVALVTGKFASDIASHDAFAFLYVASLTVLLSLCWSGNDVRYHFHLARMTFLLSALAGGLLYGISQSHDQVGPISLLYYGIRFRGWAENPNQMALALVAMPFLGGYLVRRASGVARKAGYWLMIACCVAVGLATDSDALKVSWVITLAALGGLLWGRTVLRGRGRGPLLYLTHLLAPALIISVGLWHADALATYVGNVIQGIYAQGAQGSLRTSLWSTALQVIGESPLVGFGPGRFSGVQGPFQRSEAHNTLIDWAMSAGLAGAVLHIALWAWCAWRAAKSGSFALLGAVIAMILFAQFHYGLRQPVYWTVLVLVLTLTERSPSLARRAAGGPSPRLTLTPLPPWTGLEPKEDGVAIRQAPARRPVTGQRAGPSRRYGSVARDALRRL